MHHSARPPGFEQTVLVDVAAGFLQQQSKDGNAGTIEFDSSPGDNQPPLRLMEFDVAETLLSVIHRPPIDPSTRPLYVDGSVIVNLLAIGGKVAEPPWVGAGKFSDASTSGGRRMHRPSGFSCEKGPANRAGTAPMDCL